MSQPRDMDDALDSLPGNLTDAYERIMDRIKNRRRHTLALHALWWIYKAARPLEMKELCELLVVKPGDKEIKRTHRLAPDIVIDACESLVICDEASGIVKFTHFTVNEFLHEYLKGCTESAPAFAEICLTYLAFNIFHQESCEGNGDLNEWLGDYKAGNYTAWFWAFHTRGDAEDSLAVQESVVMLFGTARKAEAIRRMWRGSHEDHISLLHTIVEHGLATICSFILKARDRYVPFILTFN
jgi:hypothetical protein